MASAGQHISLPISNTELQQAIAEKKTWFAYELIKQGAEIQNIDVNTANENGYRILHWAAYDNNLAVIALLHSEPNVDMTAVSADGCTALHIAAYNGHKIIVSWLLEHKITSVNTENKYGQTPLDLAVQLNEHTNEEQQQEIIMLLLQYCTNINCEKRGNPPSYSLERYTPLYSAIVKNYNKIEETLLRKGASRAYVLHIAAYHNEVEKVIHSKQIKLYINRKNINLYGRTPLHIAAVRGHKKAILILLKNGAKINEQDHNGCTPLDLAQEKKLQQIETLLLKNGARNGKGFLNAMLLYLHSHRQELQDRGFFLLSWLLLCLAEMRIVYFMYDDTTSNGDTVFTGENPIALPNATQKNVTSTENPNEVACILGFYSEENVPILECRDSKRGLIHHIFLKEMPTETDSSEYTGCSEYVETPLHVGNQSIETALSTYVETPPQPAGQYPLTGDTYDLNTCRQIDSTLFCEGDGKTNLFSILARKADSVDPMNMISTMSANFMLGTLIFFLIKEFYNWFSAVPENTDARPNGLIVSNDSDIQDFFKKDIENIVKSNDKGKEEEQEIVHSDADEKDKGEPDPFQGIVVDIQDNAVQNFFQQAGKRLKEIEEKLEKIKEFNESRRRIKPNENFAWLKNLLITPQKPWIEIAIAFIRERLDDLKTEPQIAKSDLYFIALDIYDLEDRIQLLEIRVKRLKENDEIPPSSATSSSSQPPTISAPRMYF